jgi:hypothetical protein
MVKRERVRTSGCAGCSVSIASTAENSKRFTPTVNGEGATSVVTPRSSYAPPRSRMLDPRKPASAFRRSVPGDAPDHSPTPMTVPPWSATYRRTESRSLARSNAMEPSGVSSITTHRYQLRSRGSRYAASAGSPVNDLHFPPPSRGRYRSSVRFAFGSTTSVGPAWGTTVPGFGAESVAFRRSPSRRPACGAASRW